MTYHDAGTGTVRPLVDAFVAWRVFSTVHGGEVNRGSGFTNASGASGTIDCKGPTSERRLEVTVHAENGKAQVKSYITSNPDRTHVGQYFGACGGGNPISADNQQAAIFTNLNKNWDGHQRELSHHLPPVMKAGLYPMSGYGTRYNWGEDHIRIEPKWDHIWGEMAVMAAAHEWAHLWQDQYVYEYPATNGLRRFYQLTCPNPHPPGEYTNFACAFGEAFADWYAVVIRQGDLPTWRRDLEENRAHLLYCGQRCTTDGSIVQGAVSAFLWDITDPAHVEPHDRVQKSPNAVLASIKGCKVRHNGSDWYPYNGIDHLIWCMERRSPYQVKLEKTHGTGDTVQTFFDTRQAKYWPIDASSYTVDNLSDDFRRLWLVNLFSRRVNVGNSPIFRTYLPDADPAQPPPDEPPSEPTCGEEPHQVACPY